MGTTPSTADRGVRKSLHQNPFARLEEMFHRARCWQGTLRALEPSAQQAAISRKGTLRSLAFAPRDASEKEVQQAPNYGEANAAASREIKRTTV